MIAPVMQVAAESLTANQTWTLLGVLVLVLGGVAKMLHWLGTRFVESIDKQTDKVGNALDKQTERMSASLDKHGETVVGNTTEVTRLVHELRGMATTTSQFHAKLEQDRVAAVTKIEDALEEVPRKVVDELQRRKINGIG